MRNKESARSLTTNIRRVENTLIESQSKWEKLLPAHVDPEKCLRLVVGSLRKNPKLLDCDPATMYGAILDACNYGLELGGAFGEAYLVPYGREVTLQLGYKGLLKLARNSGEILNVQTGVVREGDKFEYREGDDPGINHTPTANPDRNAGAISHVYVIVTLANGTKSRSVWDIGKLEAHRLQYVKSSGPSSPWTTAPEQMYIKTVLKSLLTSGVIPTSAEMAAGLAIDGATESPHKRLFENFLANSEPPVVASTEPAETQGSMGIVDVDTVDTPEPATYQGEPDDSLF